MIPRWRAVFVNFTINMVCLLFMFYFGDFHSLQGELRVYSLLDLSANLDVYLGWNLIKTCLNFKSMTILVPASQGESRRPFSTFPRQAAAAAGVDGGSILSNTNTGCQQEEEEPSHTNPCIGHFRDNSTDHQERKLSCGTSCTDF